MSLVASAATLAVASPLRRSAAQATPLASPTAPPTISGTPVAGAARAAPLPMPSTLAADTSPQFRAVV
ncbi:MAG TPA: hypothetical protein VFQ80_11840, partial [Thermomicrobiales bacterium]|nr:hypothetical protein [Thermomicrobiales bacterium]